MRRIFGLVELVGEGLWRDAGVDTVEMPGKKDAEWKAKRREIRPSPKL